MRAAPLFGAFGRLLLALAAAQLAPLALAAAEADAASARSFAFGAGCALFLGVVLILAGSGREKRLDRRETLFFAVSGWGVAGAFAAIPLALSGVAGGLSNSLAEAVSGVTATGLVVIEDTGAAPRAALLWRAVLQWLGGYATVLFAGALAPQIARVAPAPRPREWTRPGAWRTARAAAAIYASLTAAAAAALALAGAPPFDAVCYAMSAVSTGGFSTSAAGPAALGGGAQAILMLAMIAGALNLLGAWRAGASRAGALAADAETRLVVFLALAGAAGVAAVLSESGGMPPGEAARRALFAAVSALTTTGFPADLPPAAPAFVVLALAGLCLIGGASGSTAGGVKTVRALVLVRQSLHEMRRLAQPHRVAAIRAGRATVSETAMQGVWAFFVTFVLFLIAFTLIMAAHGLSFPDASLLALSALTNSGPLLLETAGAGGAPAALPPSGDLALAAAMLIGRIEVFAFLVVATPLFWRR